jgi:type I restriction enzyme S subunit
VTFPCYPLYKDSGLLWLGEVPAHWDLARLGFFFTERREKVSDKKYSALSVTKSGIVPQLETAAKTDDSDNRKLVRAGDFVINSRSDRKGSAGVAELDGSVSLINTVLQPQGNISRRFIHYLLRSRPFQEEYYRFGKGIVADLWSTNYSEMRNILLAMPPVSEQHLIVEFLDKKMAEADALIAEQQQLMNLLREKRQAVVSHAVTKGMNPDAPMKPSGVEWLGDVPAHWAEGKLKNLLSALTDGEHISPKHCDQGIPLLSAKDVRDWKIDYEVEKFVSREDAVLFWRRCRPSDGDVLVVSRGATIGRVGVVEKDVEFCLMGSVILCKPKSEFDSAFIYYCLNAKHSQASFLLSSASSAQQALYIRDIGGVPVLIPPPRERTAIVAFLKAECTKIDALLATAEDACLLLEERRTALTSAAVTGKIDVRGLVETEVA